MSSTAELTSVSSVAELIAAFPELVVQRLLKPMPDTLNLCSEIVKSVEHLITTASSSFDHIANILNSSEYEKIDKEYNIKDIKSLSKNAAGMMHRYIEAVGDIFNYGCGDNTIVDALKKNDFNPLCEYLEMLKMRISYAMEAHETAQDACRKVQSQSVTAAKYCERKEKHAKTKKRLIRGVGGAVTGLAAGGGITISFIAGALTLGMGTGIGLTITAAVLPTVVGSSSAIAAGVSTHMMASNYKELETKFKNMSKEFNNFIEISSAMLLKLDDFHSYIISISRNAKVASESLHCSQATIIGNVNALFDTFLKSYERSSPCLQKMEELKSEVENI